MLLDLVLVNPNNRILSPFAAIEPPLWLGLIASYSRLQRQTVQVVDAEAEDLTIQETVDRVLSLEPDLAMVVVMGNNPSVSSTPKMEVAGILTKKLGSRLPTTITGLHPLALPIHTLMTLGVRVWSKPIHLYTPPIAFDLLPMHLYRAHNWHCLDDVSSRSPYGVVYTSLGCPFSCSFCNIHALYGSRKVWYREPEEVVKEIDLLVSRYGVRHIKFWDELFTLDRKHCLRICDLLIDKGYDLNIWAYARVDTIDSEVLERMKRAGVNWLAYGFESGSSDVLQSSSKKATKQDAVKAVDMTHSTGIHIIGNFMFGLPGETEETMVETLKFAKGLNVEYANFYEAMAYPGSKLYSGGNHSSNWAQYDQYSSNLVGSKVRLFVGKAFIEFFTDTSYIANIKRKFGEQGVRHISEMLKLGKPQTRGVV